MLESGSQKGGAHAQTGAVERHQLRCSSTHPQARTAGLHADAACALQPRQQNTPKPPTSMHSRVPRSCSPSSSARILQTKCPKATHQHGQQVGMPTQPALCSPLKPEHSKATHQHGQQIVAQLHRVHLLARGDQEAQHCNAVGTKEEERHGCAEQLLRSTRFRLNPKHGQAAQHRRTEQLQRSALFRLPPKTQSGSAALVVGAAQRCHTNPPEGGSAS